MTYTGRTDRDSQPIQRICKYPLFFSDLSRHTPACDDPVAHAELQKVLLRLQRLAEEINHALSNPNVRKQIEISWLLQDRFEFNDKVSFVCSTPRIEGNDKKTIVKATVFEKLGRVCICGVLHTVIPTSDSVRGQYVICALYRSVLILATISKAANVYHVVMVIPLINASLDSPDSGRGESHYGCRIKFVAKLF